MTDIRRRSRSRRHRVSGDAGPSTVIFQTTCTSGDTFDPAVVLHDGCPYTAHWIYGNGDREDSNSPSYTGYSDAGPHQVTLYIPDIHVWLKSISVYNDKITGDFLGALAHCAALEIIETGENTDLASDLASLSGLTNLKELWLREHQSSLVGDIASLATLANLEKLYIAGCGIEGDIADLTGLSNLWHLDLHSHNNLTGELSDLASMSALAVIILGNTAVTGDLADIAGLTSIHTLYLYNNEGYSGDFSDLAAMTGLKQVQLTGCAYTGTFGDQLQLWYVAVSGNGWAQATVDAFLADFYSKRATFTRPTLLLYIGSDNAEPSGVYQDGDPPTTGKELIYELCNDPESEGFTTWQITYTEGEEDVTKP